MLFVCLCRKLWHILKKLCGIAGSLVWNLYVLYPGPPIKDSGSHANILSIYERTSKIIARPLGTSAHLGSPDYLFIYPVERLIATNTTSLSKNEWQTVNTEQGKAKFTDYSVLEKNVEKSMSRSNDLNREKVPADTTWSGREFQTSTTLLKKKISSNINRALLRA